MKWKWEDVIKELQMNAELPTGISTTASEVAIRAIGKFMEYRKLGTLEELRTLKEKSIPKKPVLGGLYYCPACKKPMLQGVAEAKESYCEHCGQALDWLTET